MNGYHLSAEQPQTFARYLHEQERSAGTVEKYLRDVQAFRRWLDGSPVTQERLTGWKEHLLRQGYAPVTVNSMLAALNGLFRFLGWTDCRARFVKVQRRLFRETARELTRREYERLLRTAQQNGKTRLALLMETICATGIRVSEVRYITVEAARRGRAEIALKGKIRTILLPKKLARKLLQYAAQNKTARGEIFLTASGKGLSRRQIWAEMKQLFYEDKAFNNVSGYDYNKPNDYQGGDSKFEGWYLSADFSGAPVDPKTFTMPGNDVYLYAKWTPATYTVTFARPPIRIAIIGMTKRKSGADCSDKKIASRCVDNLLSTLHVL